MVRETLPQRRHAGRGGLMPGTTRDRYILRLQHTLHDDGLLETIVSVAFFPEEEPER
jgi:hypothetical protein